MSAPTRYVAMRSSAAEAVLHLVRENAEASLCGIPRAMLSSSGAIDDTTVCRDCIDWVPKRWTDSNPKVSRST